jgi:trehalose 6-phosphate phosphatase
MRTWGPCLPPRASLSWAYFLDVDGTLVNIANTPQGVVADKALLELIGNLHRASGGAVALVSGRMISDLQSLTGMPDLPLAGLHGLERRDSTGRLWIHAAAPATKHAMMQALAPLMMDHPGLLLEDKGLTLALHYRRVPELASFVHKTMRFLLKLHGQGLELQRGKCVVEIKPAGIDKGTAVTEYLAESPFRDRRAVFIGDDLNDEHGFAEVNRLDGISIKVGTGASCARFRLRNVTAVRQWLGQALKDMQ